ncbi:agmatine deiminase family protein [Neptuniibacter sp. QD29_5]|uniref:agmatine deiminase family protein n=1 Tax=Neptuniibacter sp. QD29_5 TaxID=3398207 RepID=UPI0039F475EA
MLVGGKGAVAAQKIGYKQADDNARRVLEKAFHDRVIEQIAIDGIVSGGGSIHCVTQQEIKL